MKIRCSTHNRRVMIIPKPLGIPQVTLHRDDGSLCDPTPAYFMGKKLVSFRAIDHHILVFKEDRH